MGLRWLVVVALFFGLSVPALAGEGIRFAAIHVDRPMPYENKPTRKPAAR